MTDFELVSSMLQTAGSEDGNHDNKKTKETHSHAARDKWTGKMDFFLSSLGAVIGIGNVWRFPYMCFRNGGGAFLIPYSIMLFIVAIPFFLLELTIGQYSAMAPVSLYRNLCPAFRGTGICQWIFLFVGSSYYMMIIAWAIFYLFASFTSDLPWQHCNHDYNTDRCVSDVAYRQCKADNDTTTVYNMGRCFRNMTEAAQYNITADIPSKLRVSAALEYLNNYVQGISSGVDDVGEVKWRLVLCLLGGWALSFFCLLKGIKTSGKVVYFTVTFPFVLIIVLIVQGVTLPGAYEGIRFYLVPDWEKLAEVEVWEKAAVQLFFSLGIGTAVNSNYASFNNFHDNIIRYTFLITICNFVTSFSAGFAIFSILGFMAHELGVPVDKVATKGPGLAFVAYPDAVTRLPAAPFWSILFFFMLILLGIDSAFAAIEALSSSILDEVPWLRPRKMYVTLMLCVSAFLSGIPFTTQAGTYFVTLMDNCVASWFLLLMCACEIIAVSHIYGIENFLMNLWEITGFLPGLCLRSHLVCLYMTVIPGIIIFLILMTWMKQQPLTLGSYVFPPWTNALYWILPAVIISVIPICFIYELCWVDRRLPWRKRLRVVVTPSKLWWKNAALHGKKRSSSYNGTKDSRASPDDCIQYQECLCDNPTLLRNKTIEDALL